MFSETLSLFDEANQIIDQVSGYAKLSPEYAVSLERRLIINLIASKGREESPGYSGPVNDFLSLIALGTGVFMENLTSRKIEYVQLLFNMLPVLCWRQFYYDLRLGLDNVIKLWDASVENPNRHFFTKPPTDYIRHAIGYKVKKQK